MPLGRKPSTKSASGRSFFICKLSQLHESAKKRVTERELKHLNSKVGKLLNKIDDNELELATSQTDQCLQCKSARATMQTLPCGHCIVCRKCFVRSIQEAVLQRALPLRCMLCRERILNLNQPSGSCRPPPRLPQSVSQYSVASSEGASSSVGCDDRRSSSSLHSMSSACSRASSCSRSSIRSASSSKSAKKRVSFSPTPSDRCKYTQEEEPISVSDSSSGLQSPVLKRYQCRRNSVGSKVSIYSESRLSPIRESRSERSSSRNGSSTSSSRCSSSLSSSQSWRNASRFSSSWKPGAPLADDETENLLQESDDENN